MEMPYMTGNPMSISKCRLEKGIKEILAHIVSVVLLSR